MYKIVFIDYRVGAEEYVEMIMEAMEPIWKSMRVDAASKIMRLRIPSSTHTKEYFVDRGVDVMHLQKGNRTLIR